ncbi:AMP-binding protein [Paralcaligenes sp. KSB-10]|uniref:AMP-binding protein n=1 Tax=Paralcaligenes sp. KSB-10 TaxID=2901142 RepID=UPI001E47A279|nr:AMP-binding protein [Paralcaligenes sp. KSB-10]UHL64405.1 AMP-binding protein [Paralcaligenes sp. KSB-10]
MENKYEHGLDQCPANYSALTPISFLKRAAQIFPEKTAVIDDDTRLSYLQLHQRCRRMACTLQEIGIKAGDTVAVLCFNSHELLESHYSVPMAGAVLNALNTRLDAATLRFILGHGEARLLFYDTEFEALVAEVVKGLENPPLLASIERIAKSAPGFAALTYEDMIAAGDPEYSWQKVDNEWNAISLNYTSGTTGNPKGVVYHHRGAYLAAMSNAMAFNMNPDTVYLWTLPMFHCNGWGYPWAIAAVGGTHVCLRKIQAETVLAHIEQHRVTHLCGAPVVLNLLLSDFDKRGTVFANPVQFGLGGAAPPSPVIQRAQKIGFSITHLYGLTETYGPSTLCVWQDDWEGLAPDKLAQKMARQGVANFAIDEVQVLHLAEGIAVPADGKTLGEIVLKGNTLMKGYLKNAKSTQEAFKNGWFHTGDLAVMHPDGYVEVKDRSKDIIISGGENISSQEIEEVLYRHPMVYEAAVVAQADPHWGEVPCAFVCLKENAGAVNEQDIIEFCRAGMASFKVPKRVVFGELPKTSTGKIRKNLLRDQVSQTGQDLSA